MKKFIQFFLVVSLFFFIKNELHVQAATFNDVPSDHYAIEAINWASENGIVNGIGNNLFAPSDAFTYEQFAKLVTEQFKLEANEQYYLSMGGTSNFFSSKKPYDSWSAPYYNALATYQVPYLRYTDDQALRSQPVNRGLLAQVLGYLLNNDADLENSIAFLQKYGITKMKYPQYTTAELQFDIAGPLSRAEAVLFFYRLHNAGFNKIHEAIANKALTIHETNTAFNQFATETKKLLDPRVVDYLSGTNTKYYSAETRKLENDVYNREFSKYGVKVDTTVNTIKFLPDTASKLLNELPLELLQKLTAFNYSLVRADGFYDDFEGGYVSTITFQHPEAGYIFYSNTPRYNSLTLGKTYEEYSSNYIELFAELISAVSKMPVSAKSLPDLEAYYRAHYQPMTNPNIFIDSARKVLFSVNNIGRYDVMVFK